mmetsp:Transcript_16219/g.44948  ORF Transcript_16219/g.44948 Transcript_16219/m.44948 type:complete len:508 (-) Transcript_16219:127-1650(-)|eukprot:CAMPEP_0198132900 /NCGR_PEP_ID=MMETSP1442-20131203/59288_1 /TAXON_ID= /ORGANISM="Craspedostauros australis, Strain CCMP3328" /LENGTH=507 /DNA_ID=CAMNT_0043794003 /DNA_START=294 /DNA_END=1817 /DNA_ORIENTATION=+
MSDIVSASDWMKGIVLSVMASLIGAASKLALRQSWLLLRDLNGGGAAGGHNGGHQNGNIASDSGSSGGDSGGRRNRFTTADEDDGEHAVSSAPVFGIKSSSMSTQTLSISVSAADEEGNEDKLLVPPDTHQMHPDDEDNDDDDDGNDDSEQPASQAQEESHQQQEEQARKERRTRRISSFLSYSGMIGMSFLNPACSVLAMQYASPSILAPFSGLTLVWVILFSYPTIGESPSTTQIVAASLIVLGEVVVAIFGDHTNNEDVTLHELRAQYLDANFLAYCVATTLYMLLMAYWATSSSSTVLRKFAWGTAGGAITGFQNFLKDALTILHLKTSGQIDTLPWFFALFLLLAVATAFGGLLLLNQCMKRYDATFSAAMFVGSFVVSASIMSSIHYHTIRGLDGIINYVMYPTGLLVLMVGVLILVRQNHSNDDCQDATARSLVFTSNDQDDDGNSIDGQDDLASNSGSHHSQNINSDGNEGDPWLQRQRSNTIGSKSAFHYHPIEPEEV